MARALVRVVEERLFVVLLLAGKLCGSCTLGGQHGSTEQHLRGRLVAVSLSIMSARRACVLGWCPGVGLLIVAAGRARRNSTLLRIAPLGTSGRPHGDGPSAVG